MSTLNARAIALHGLGFERLLIAVQGLLPSTIGATPPTSNPGGIRRIYQRPLPPPRKRTNIEEEEAMWLMEMI